MDPEKYTLFIHDSNRWQARATPQQNKRCHLAANEGERAKQFTLASLSEVSQLALTLS